MRARSVRGLVRLAPSGALGAARHFGVTLVTLPLRVSIQ